ncbi:MAG: CapA family protein [Spirochaetes bacterium]|nr:CapA family protein [Spirochaetota bacterium]
MKKYIIILVSFFLFCSETKSEEFTILFMGDFLTGINIEHFTRNEGADYPYKRIKPLIDKYDLVFANLESSITERGKPVTNKAWVFRTSYFCASYLPSLGLDVVSLSNNHILDYGKDGLTDTIDFLKKNNIAYCGAGMNESEARKPAAISSGKKEILFLSYNDLPPSYYYAKGSKYGSAEINDEKIISDILKHKTKDNLVFVSLHWGIEHSTQIKPEQIEQAHKYIDAGADGIIGHHPHVPQGVEIYKGKPVFYSLGNAVNGYYNQKYMPNIFGAVKIKDGNVAEVRVIPVEGDNYKMKFQPFPLKGEEAVTFLKKVESLSSRFKTKFIIDNGEAVVFPDAGKQ